MTHGGRERLMNFAVNTQYSLCVNCKSTFGD